MIVGFDPTDAAEQRALCKQWTEGNPPVFAVARRPRHLGGGQPALHHPGRAHADAGPVDDHDELDGSRRALSLVDREPTTRRSWPPPSTGGSARGGSGTARRWASSSRTRRATRTRCNSYLLPDLKKIGIDPQVVTISADLDETASTDSDATLAVERLKAAGVQSVIPLLPENAFTPYLGAETSQEYFPTLLLSDYQSEIEIALGLIPVPYEKALNGQEGVTAETLGGIDLPIPESQGGYDPGVRSCWTRGTRPTPRRPRATSMTTSRSRGRCRAGARRSASLPRRPPWRARDLNRRTFVEAMSRSPISPAGTHPC